MPKKACCCRQPEPEENSCCRPIFKNCVDKKYTFEVLFKAKYPCFKNNPLGTTPRYREAQYRCLNNGTLHNIPGNAETFILTLEYKISKPANVYYTQEDVAQIGDIPIPCGYPYYACWPNFDPTIEATWPPSASPFGGPPFVNPFLYLTCIGCGCLNNDTYSFCNFDEEKLKESCNCTERGYITQDPTQFWNQCYSFWTLHPPDKDYEGMNQEPPNSGCYTGCTYTAGDRNLSAIADSYSFQFIPDPNIPEQNLPSYQPRLQPDVLNFQVHCNQGDFLDLDVYRGYNLVLELGIGYKASFNCGVGVTEILEIPFQQTQDFFGYGYFNDGIYVKQNYRRSSLTNDPMDSCVPQTTYNYPYTTNSCINVSYDQSGGYPIARCPDPQTNLPTTLYKDEWSNCKWGPAVPYAGSLEYGLIAADPGSKMPQFCDSSFYEIQWENHCQYFNLTDDIIVESD
jgi:hypothetical protein